ncbi:MAG: methyl-accepting chemotaxis protein [Thiomicrorhabdus sp.]|nr:methyl-accepting chemotaxis protein [Thiomicrorhabdus sp.]
MRNNQPITNEEYIVPDGLTLVSKTDLTGNIIECNDAFEAASGFSRSQLIGQPHNIIRHPDVPEAVFADLWRSLKAGETWSQIVKNRRSDGGFYWVRANASPIYTNKKISGYMSVRTPATEAEKQAATKAYQDIKAGRAKIQSARIFYGMNWSKLNFFARLPLQYQLPLLMLLVYIIPLSAYAISDGHSVLTLLAVTLFGLIPPFLYGLRLSKSQREVQKDLKTIASREHLSNEWFNPKTILGKQKTAMRAVYLSAREQIEESAYQLDQARLLQTAMDQISTNIMITDANLNINYMNDHMVEFLTDKEAVLQSALPQFKVNNLLGENIDVFHKDPSHQRGLLNTLTEPYLGKITIEDTYLELYVIPVFNRAGVRTATIAEWRDKSAEVLLLQEVNSTVQAAKAGKLNSRIDLSRVEGVAKELSQSINELISSIEKPINETVKLAVSLSEGNLTKSLDGEYLGRFALLQDSLNVGMDNLNALMLQTKFATQAVSSGVEQIYQGSMDLNDRTQDQAASLEETASSMEEMTAAVKQNADNSREASNMTQTSAKQARTGVEVMHRAIEAMEEIHSSSQKINDIISLIDSIAFQTNLLALNAAVEAARAGEHGRGFAVVASEVRNLAGKSSEAAKDIRNLIEDTVKKVSEGTVHVKASGDALNEIVESISNIDQIITEIASSSNEQSEGVTLVNSSITDIDTAVQQNAALVEETAATAEELGKVSTKMSDNVQQFTLNETNNQAVDPDQFDFSAAMRELKQYRVKIVAFTHDIDITFNTDAKQGYLGSWLFGEGQSFSAFASFQSLVQAQQSLHSKVSELLQLKQAGSATKTEVQELKDLIETMLQDLKQLKSETTLGGINSAPPPMPAPKAMTTAKKPSKPRTPAIKAPQSTSPAPIKTYVKKTAKPTGLQTPAPSQPVANNNDDEWADF